MNRFVKPCLGLLGALLLLLSGPASAGPMNGTLQGRVTEEGTNKPLAGVTVVASGPQGEQTEFTDGTGRYMITELPPGDYVVRFYYANVRVERQGILIQVDKTLGLNAAIPTAKAKEQKYVIKERAPVIDVSSAQVQTQVNNDLVRNTPVGRSYASVLTLAPGSTTDATGYSFNGATGPENQFIVDGLNTTNPSFGTLGSNIPLEFIAETQIITSGYAAEFGRATGGIVNVILKAGSNQWTGGVYGYYTPFQLDYPLIARPGEAVARTQRSIDRAFDVGAGLGGPIIKDRLWFYAGFQPSYSWTTYTRILRRRTADQFVFDPAQPTDSYPGDPDAAIACPPWLQAQSMDLCAPTSAATYRTEDLDQRFWRRYESETRIFDYVLKLDLRINDNNRATLSYVAKIGEFNGITPRFNGSPYTGVYEYSNPSQNHDVVASFISKLLDRSLQLELRVGLHHERGETIPTALGASQGGNTDTRTLSLYVFEDELEPCKTVKLGPRNNVNFNPCPVSSYRDGGFGFLGNSVNNRAVVAASATYFLKLWGTHAIKLGGDFEYNYFQNYRAFTGGANGGSFTTFESGGPYVQRTQFGQVDPKDPNRVLLFDGQEGRPLGFTATTTTLNESVYLRDSWNIGWVPGLNLNLGVRWEGQQVRDINGKTQIGIFDNWAPRIGLTYDVLAKGIAKLYASYGRFYEAIPLDINDRQFSAEGLVMQDLAPGDEKNSCKTDLNGRVDLSTCKFPAPTRANLNGGTFGIVSPLLQGQFSNELVIGAQYSPGLDLVLGVSYMHRDLGRVVEDISADGGRTYVLANPGVPADAGTVKRLQSQIDNLEKQARGASDPAKAEAFNKELSEVQNQLSLYKAAANFETPRRDYNALIITAQKRFSYNFTLLASYTYSRTIGNYPGLFQASNGQLDPNISSQYDLPELLVNRNGPLPSDRPHNFKLSGAYSLPLKAFGELTLGVKFDLQSGSPIEVLGRHPLYGANETFILPRGAGGRTPIVTQLDVHLGWSKTFKRGVRADIGLDVFNMLMQRNVLSVDQSFTTDRVLPIPNGTHADLAQLKTTSGTVPRLNPNYGQPTSYQAPLSLRVNARLSF